MSVSLDLPRSRPFNYCWLCQAQALTLVRRGVRPGDLTVDNFKITDSDYGRTGDIYECAQCHFRQAASLGPVLRFYEQMADSGYEDSRTARSIQAQNLIKLVGWRGQRNSRRSSATPRFCGGRPGAFRPFVGASRRARVARALWHFTLR
jgi:hypothetical protein